MSSINTGIEWCDRTWNPTTGCDKVSPGCTHCYAEAITKRFHTNFPNGFTLTQYPERLKEPLSWRKPSRIFVNSMSDLFHEEVTLDFLKQVFEVMRETPHHIYQILTKRHKRLLELAPELDWSDNIWMGVSVENQNYVNRIDCLRKVPTKVRFLSCEPLLGALELDLTDIHWVIVGLESGRNARPCDLQSVRDIIEQCKKSQVAVFCKQLGTAWAKKTGTYKQDPKGENLHLWDEIFKVREFPNS